MTFLRILVVAVAVGASALQAQVRSCSDIAARVAAGQSESGDLSALARCENERASAVAAAVRRTAQETDVAKLRSIMFAATLTVDADVHDALRSVALSGSIQARAYALCALAGHEEGAPAVTYPRQDAAVSGYSCAAIHSEKRRQAQDRPLPAGHRESSRRLAQEILGNASTPAEIRPVAQYLAFVTTDLTSPPTETLPPPEPGKIRLAYDCGNRFWVRNGNRSPVQVVYEVEGTSERATLSVPLAARGTDYGEFGMWTHAKGTVRLLFNGAVIQTEANGNRPCDG